MLEALCRQSSTTLDIGHAEDGPPITRASSMPAKKIALLPREIELHSLSNTGSTRSARSGRPASPHWSCRREGHLSPGRAKGGPAVPHGRSDASSAPAALGAIISHCSRGC